MSVPTPSATVARDHLPWAKHRRSQSWQLIEQIPFRIRVARRNRTCAAYTSQTGQMQNDQLSQRFCTGTRGIRTSAGTECAPRSPFCVLRFS